MKLEEQESNDNDGSNKSSSSKENDIKSRLRKNPNKTKNLYTDDNHPKKIKKNSDSYWKEVCREILDILKKDEKSDLFRQPAVKSFSSQEDKEFYRQRIKEPRDLGTISKKLKSDNYSPKDFCDDIELCWSNAISFNEENTEAYQSALYLRELANKLFKEKEIEEIIDKYNNEKENNKDSGEEKDVNTNDNTNNSNNNTNDSNNTPESMDNNNAKEKDKSTKEDDKESNISNKSNKDDDSYNESDNKKHKMTGKKRHRHKHKDKEKNKDKEDKKHRHDEDKKVKKRGPRRKKIDNDNIIKISKRKINFSDLEKKYPIKYPVLLSPEQIDKMAIKKGKNKIKKMVKLTNFGKNQNHENNNNNKIEIHKKRGRPPAINIVNTIETNNKISYKFDWEFLQNNNKDNKKLEEQINIEDNKYEIDRRKIENEQMSNYDTNCNGDKVQTNHKHKAINHNININGTENIPKKKKNEGNKNKINNNNNNNVSIITNNNAIKEIQIDNNDKNKNKNNESGKKVNNVEINNNNDVSIKELDLLTNINNAVKIVEKKVDKSLDLRIEIARNFDALTDSNMIDLLVYIENIRPQSIRILENDTIYIDMEAFNEDTFNKVFTFIKSFV